MFLLELTELVGPVEGSLHGIEQVGDGKGFGEEIDGPQPHGLDRLRKRRFLRQENDGPIGG